MAGLSERIERFIKELMDEDCRIELRRNELAQHFGCAPSQINYVLSTRFTIERGYLIDSRRGEGGYVRIVQMRPEHVGGALLSELLDQIDKSISRDAAHGMIYQLGQLGLITPQEAGLMAAATSDGALSIGVGAKDVLRASVLRAMLRQAFHHQGGANGNDV